MLNKDANRKIRTTFFIDYYAAAGNIFGITVVHELGFSYLSISIFNAKPFKMNQSISIFVLDVV